MSRSSSSVLGRVGSDAATDVSSYWMGLSIAKEVGGGATTSAAWNGSFAKNSMPLGPAGTAGILGSVVASCGGRGSTSSTTVASMSGISSAGAAGGGSSEKLEREGSPCTPGSAGFWKKSSSGGGGSSRALAAGKNWVAPSDGASGTSGTSGSAIS